MENSQDDIEIFSEAGADLKLNAVTGAWGAKKVELISESNTAQYIITHTGSIKYILTVDNLHDFTMINGSLTFSSTFSPNTQLLNLELSFAYVIGTNSNLTLTNIILHFGSTMNSLINVTGGKVVVDRMSIINEGVDNLGKIVWVRPLVEINANVSAVVVEFLYGIVAGCEYNGANSSSSDILFFLIILLI
jgi:hypothetical protein